MSIPLDRLLTRRELADTLRTSTRTIARLDKRGEDLGLVWVGDRPRYDPEKVRNYIATRSARGAAR